MQNHKNVSEATYIKISEHKVNEKNRTKKTQRIVSSVVVLLCFVFLIMGGVNLVSATTNAYILSVDGEEIATMVSANDAELALEQCLEAQRVSYLEAYDYDITYVNDVEIKEVSAVGAVYSSVSEAAEVLADSLHMMAEATAININGKTMLYVANQTAALEAVSKAKSHYANAKTEEDVLSVYTSEKIETIPAVVECNQVFTADEAADFMLYGRSGPEGEALPIITVNVERVSQEVTALAYGTVEVDDPTLARGKREVAVEGVDGTQKVTLKQVEVNGVPVSSEQIDSEVIVAATDEIVNVGAKASLNISRGLNGGGMFGWPLSSDAPGEVSSRFGWRSRGWHSGIDITNPIGSIIYAAESGTVTFADFEGGYGLLVIISHSEGVETYYAHTSEVYVSPGDFVERGTSIAAIGMTGTTTGAHVHFEVRIDGTPVDPIPYFE